MAKIMMAKSQFTVIPEGDYIFKITKVKYDETFGKLEIKLETKDGQSNVQTFGLMDENGDVVEGALIAFSIMAKNALNNFDMADVDPNDLLGKYFRATVVHDVKPSRKDSTKTVTFVKLTNEAPADGFEGEEPAADIDLNALLG